MRFGFLLSGFEILFNFFCRLRVRDRKNKHDVNVDTATIIKWSLNALSFDQSRI